MDNKRHEPTGYPMTQDEWSRDDIELAIAQVRARLDTMPADQPETTQVRVGLVELYFYRAAEMTDAIYRSVLGR